MRKVIILAGIVAFGTLLSSCSGGYTCPTYSKKEIKSIQKIDQERV